MKHHVDLDFAMEETAICILDDQRWMVCVGKAASEPIAIAILLIATGPTYELRTGRHRGGAASALADGWVGAASLPVICINARYMTYQRRLDRRPSYEPGGGHCRK